LQEELFTWARFQGAETIRPAKATAASNNGRPALTVVRDGAEVEYTARLVVGADGKLSGTRRVIGAETVSDPEQHRFGGVSLRGVATDPRALCLAITPEIGCFWFPIGDGAFRHYLRLTPDQIRESGVDRSFDAYLALAAGIAPEGKFADVEQAGPIGFFPNNCVWSSRIAGDEIVLIGDAAGAADPTNGHGTSLLFRDVRELSELLLGERDWDVAIAAFAERRRTYYEVIVAHDRWYIAISTGLGAEADRRRERHQQAKEKDPTLGGFNLIEERGPDGLVPDENARCHYFGEDLDVG
jgi:2-polyprenyl-6-methoxyphenol hydroxylase-like FAD-dependent oxidoreductase